ncbi:tripartite tricarboxylate transporter TctB family protein [Alkalihalophilus lindianensis]|uniref:Tripartite tricarboxylate transporter TctB family protein n=1 Tax=Alkalihalophilus lindianensis TaxID=1630542 RepID=A0ABU3X5I4_9BACI|nr:tripartite tricarboxylate transporter TctB family protein [Alkalihalophilus lindianensis]MDV2682877.1 tripartite tricarboxylate transporter TctB family protein [Alkalihalophilus lindianensis]
MLKLSNDGVASVFLLAISVLMFVATYSIQQMTVSNIGADFAPRLVAVGLFILSVILLITSIRKQKNPKATLEEEVEEDEEIDASQPISKKSVLLTTGLLIGYVALIPIIGFLLMTAIYLFLQMYVLAEKSHRNIVLFLVVSIVSSGLIYYCFKSIFYLRLPAGILG